MRPIAFVAGASALVAAGPALADLPSRSYDGYRHMMGDFGYGGFGMIWGAFLMIVLLAALVAGVVALMRWGTLSGPANGGTGGRATEVLDMRFANGEIDAEEYAQRKKLLVG